MIYSLNEIDAHCKKAARGAGFEWGYAEEIGKAARWLAAFDLPGIAVLAAYLKERDEHPELFCRPDVSNMAHIISRNSGSLCPVLTGAWLCDSAGTDTQASMQFELLYYPLLLVPFLAQIAGSIQQTLTFEYRSTRLQYSDGVLNLDNDADLGCRLTDTAQLTMNATAIEGKSAAVIGQDISTGDWELLNKFAFKTYVPATEASRQGAGPVE